MERMITSLIQRELMRENSKVIILIGQRQVGKTYELRRLQKENPSALYFDFEDVTLARLFTPSVADLESIIGDKDAPRIVLFDEIQYLKQSGSILKLLHDHFPKTRVVVTGSASFLLLKEMGDSLFGRHLPYTLYPLTVREILEDTDFPNVSFGKYSQKLNAPKITAMIDNLLVYGSLPDILLENEVHRKEAILRSYVKSLLFKDVLEIEGIRMPQVFKQLLSLLALQIGNEINPNELAQQLEINRKTALEYIGFYEKFNIVYTLRSFNHNQRRELKKGFKVYFTDLGIRNAVIDNFMGGWNRHDKGALFENLVMNIVSQNISYFQLPYCMYFWRTSAGNEVDLVLQSKETNQLIPVEIKYSKTQAPSRSFHNRYQDMISEEHCINKDNLWQYI